MKVIKRFSSYIVNIDRHFLYELNQPPCLCPRAVLTSLDPQTRRSTGMSVEMSRSDHVIGDRSRSRDFQKIGIGRKKSGIGNFFYQIFLLFDLMLQNKNDHVHVLKSS